MSGFVCFPGSRSLWYCMAPISAPLHFWTRRIAYCLPIGGGTSRLLEQKGNARLLELELEEKHGRYIYEVELLTVQGQVRELKFDASSGKLLEDEEDD